MKISPVWQQLSIAVATFFVSFSAGASVGYPSVLIYQLKKKDSEFPIDLDTGSWMGSIHGLAGVFGAIAPVIMQWKGRKRTFIAACFILIFGWVLAYAANSIAMILLSETVLGFSSSVLLTVSYDILTEMITPIYRNVAGQTYYVLNALGLATAGVLSKFQHWRMISVILCLPAVVAVLLSFTWLESPLWLAYKEELEKCKTNFTKLRGTDEHAIKELQEVIAAHKERQLRNKTFKRDTFRRRFWRQITSRDFMLPALHVLLLLNHLYWSGTVVIVIYSIELVFNATQNETAAFIGSIIINFVFAVSAIVSTILVRFYKNKTALLLSTSCAIVCLFCATVVTYLQSVGIVSKESLLALYFLVFYIICTSSGQVPVELALSAELIPVKHRGIGGAFFVICTCALCSCILKISPYLFVYLGLHGTFLTYTLSSLVGGLLIWRYVPETKGKTLQEIENFYTIGTFEIELFSIEEDEPMYT